MSVSPVSASTAVHAANTAASPHPVAKPANNQSAIPQDRVTLTSALTSKPAVPSGDLDHDGDSK
jgi:hypothetical protein